MMLREAAREEIRKVGAPLWLLLNGTSWPGSAGDFDIVKNGALSIVAHLAYCAVGADEKAQKERATVVPCRVFQDLILAQDVDFIEALRSFDFADVEVIRTQFFVAVVIPARQFLLIGVRGTQFAYDWLINIKAIKARSESGGYFHRGFLREAEELAAAIRQRLRNHYAERLARQGSSIYFAGHSLGGAVAAILNQMPFPSRIEGSYVFGAPRISDGANFTGLYQPFATRRYLDIVPHCPPQKLNYTDYINQMAPSGETYEPAGRIEAYFFASWLIGMAVKQFPKNHSMERYRFEVLDVARRQPSIERYWNFPDLTP